MAIESTCIVCTKRLERIKSLEAVLRKHRICPYCGKQLSKVECKSVHTCSRCLNGGE